RLRGPLRSPLTPCSQSYRRKSHRNFQKATHSKQRRGRYVDGPLFPHVAAMRKYAIIPVGIIVLIAFYWWYTFIGTIKQKTAPRSSPIAPLPRSASPSSATLPKTALDSRSKEERMSKILAETSRTPIEFFGKVIDQHGIPIEGVRVTANVEAVTRFLQEG